jgi:hypothetical protein
VPDVGAHRFGQDEQYLIVREILSEGSTLADGALSRERSDFYRFGYATLGLTAMIEDSFAFAFSPGQSGVIQDLNFSTHQDMFADVSGNPLRDCSVLIGVESRPPLHLEDHIIPPVLSTF